MQETGKLRAKLMECKSVKEMLILLLNNFDLDFRPNIFIKATIVEGLIQAFEMLNPKEKKERV